MVFLDCENITARACTFIRGYFKKAGKKVAVLGLSGGLDSAVALALSERALGKGNVLAVLMPSSSTSIRDMDDARGLAREMGVRAREVPIEPIVRSFGSLAAGRLAMANLAARARMSVLYSIAGRENGLVVGTGDKSEIMLGYFTKHGDGGADLLPLGGLYKTEVRELARHLGIQASIVEKPSSPGLWKGHTAEGELGFSYETADAVLKGMEKGVSRKRLAGKFGKDKVESIFQRVEANSHKRGLPPAFEL